MARSDSFRDALLSLWLENTRQWISVRIRSGKTIDLNFRPSDTIRDLKLKIPLSEGIHRGLPDLFYKGKHLNDNRTLDSYNISWPSTLECRLRLKISVRTMSGETVSEEVYSSNATIGNLLAQIQDKEDDTEFQQRLFFDGRPLNNNCTLADYEIMDGSTLLLMRRPKGWIPIFVNTHAGKTICLEVQLSDTIRDFKFRIEEVVDICHYKWILFTGEQLLNSNCTLSDYIHRVISLSSFSLAGSAADSFYRLKDISVSAADSFHRLKDISVSAADSFHRLKDISVSAADSVHLLKDKELMKYLSKIDAMIMSTPPDISIIVQSPIGSGKSTALVTATLQRVDRELECPQVIYVVPDRESAIQNMDLLLEMGKDSPVTSDLGVPPSKDNYIPLHQKPPVEAQVIIGTPLTICNWIVAKKLDIDGMEMFLIDDVDRVLAEPGFKDSVVRIMKDISKRRPQCQVIMCFTISSEAVEAFVSKIKQVLSKKEFLSFTGETEVPSLDSVKQYKVNVPDEPSKEKVIIDKLLDLIAEAGQTIVYVDTIVSAPMLVERLKGNKFMYKPLDGADTQEQRDKILEEFKEKRFQVLISTKILDWVFDPSQVGLVVFYDLSN